MSDWTVPGCGLKRLVMSLTLHGSGKVKHAADEAPADGSPNVVTSIVSGSAKHAPVLDIDIPFAVIPSTPPGHGHLYFDVELTWTQYSELLRALADAGIIEQGYYHASLARGFSSARLPWIKKPKEIAA